jgi:ubiquinone/menaquinone biosynthesis C-methylase UbiE
MNAIFDKIAFQYDENRGGESRGVKFSEALEPLIDKNKRVLEMGVGTGVVAGALQSKGYDIIGLDVSSEMLKRAVDRVTALVWSDMNKLPFLDDFFGSIYSVWALHLADDVPASLAEIRRVLSDGGCYINCSAANAQVSPPKDPAGLIVADMQLQLSGPQLTRDSPEELEKFSKDAGFEFETVVNLSHTYKTSVSEVLLHIERGGMSTLVKASDDQRRDVIEPALAELRKIPNPDDVILRDRVHQFSVLRAV